jgi:hypothetical protein
MDMTPYIGRVRLACPRETCLDRTKARPDAGCASCPECQAEIIDLDGKVLAVFQARSGDACVAPTEPRPQIVGATHASPAPEPEQKAAVNPRPEPVGATGGRPKEE